jgi:predicted enzyme involved in methoxymalonyl-ACP biosynthesis
MQSFAELKKNLKKDFTGFNPVKIALLGDSATQLLSQAIRGMGYNDGFDLKIWEADFNQIERQVFDEGSELYEYKPEIVIIFHSTHKLLYKYNKLAADDKRSLAETRMDLVEQLNHKIQTALKAKFIYYNYPEINDTVFGNYANKTSVSFLYQLRKLNFELMQYAAASPNFFLCDLSSVQNFYGKATFFHSSMYVNTEMVLSIDVLPAVAFQTTGLIQALHGKFKKCLILDLDNTTWGGIIGDDGLENIQVGGLGIGKKTAAAGNYNSGVQQEYRINCKRTF